MEPSKAMQAIERIEAKAAMWRMNALMKVTAETKAIWNSHADFCDGMVCAMMIAAGQEVKPPWFVGT